MKRTTITLTTLSFAALSLTALHVNAAATEALKQAQLALLQGDAAQAYQFLLPYESELAGSPQYDTLFGQAALRNKQATRAIMAFERCLAVQPKNGDCRLGLAQAHLSLNERSSAIHELNVIKKSAPPEQIAQVVDNYLGQLSGTAKAPKKFRAWAELALGYDDNVNVAPSTSTITLPGTNNDAGIGISFKTEEDSSSFAKAGVGASYKTAMNAEWDFVTGLSAQTTRNFSTDDGSYFDKTDQISGYLGATGKFGRHRTGLMLQGQHYRLHGDSYRNLLGGTWQHSYLYSPRTQISSFLQRSRFNYRFKGNQGLQDVNSTILGSSVARSMLSNQVVTFAGFYLGSDDKVKLEAHKNIESDFWGVRAGATWLFHTNWQASLNLQNENRKYSGNYLLSLGGFADQLLGTEARDYKKSRQDHLISTDFSLTWQALPQLQVRPQYSYIKNNSNIAARDYDRNIASLGVRYDF